MDDLAARLAAASWRKSPGYWNDAGYQVGPHEYIVREWDPGLYDDACAAITSNPTFHDYYPPKSWEGEFRHWHRPYLVVGAYVYWCLEPILNRETVATSSLERLQGWDSQV